MDLYIDQVEDLEALIPTVLKFAAGKKTWLLFGEIGAGKTTFTKAFCAHLGVADSVTSPTFSLVNEYTYVENGQPKKLFHLDLYRLKTVEEAIDIGIEEYLYQPGYCLIEWPEIIESIWPDEVLRIKIEAQEGSKRKIILL